MPFFHTGSLTIRTTRPVRRAAWNGLHGRPEGRLRRRTGRGGRTAAPYPDRVSRPEQVIDNMGPARVLEDRASFYETRDIPRKAGQMGRNMGEFLGLPPAENCETSPTKARKNRKQAGRLRARPSNTAWSFSFRSLLELLSAVRFGLHVRWMLHDLPC